MTDCAHQVTFWRKRIQPGRSPVRLLAVEACAHCGHEPPPKNETAIRLGTGRRQENNSSTTREANPRPAVFARQRFTIIPGDCG